MTIDCQPGDFGRVFLEHEQARIKRLDDAVYEAAMMGVRVIRAAVPVDRGGMRRSVHVEREGRTPVIVEDTPYAAAQEAGTRPFTPPLEPLVEWARRQAPNLGIDESEVYAVAVGTQKAIAAFGLRATWATRDALPDLARILATELRKVLP